MTPELMGAWAENASRRPVETREVALWAFDDARRWLIAAPAGAQRIYHEGNLAVEREKDPAVEAAARLMKWAAARSLVLLTQTRLEPTQAVQVGESWFIKRSGSFAYTATRTSLGCGVVPKEVPERDVQAEIRL